MRYIDNRNQGVGVSFLELLQLAFIILKLCKVIDWSWWFVLMPTWVVILFIAVVLIIYKIKTRQGVKVNKQVAEEVLSDFQQFCKDKPIGLDRKQNELLIGVNGVWEDAIEEYLKSISENQEKL